MIGFDSASHIFIPDSMNRQTAVLDQVDNTVLVDSSSRPMFGPLGTGRVIEIDDRKVTVGGQYVLGTGFMGFGVALHQHSEFCTAVSAARCRTEARLPGCRLKPSRWRTALDHRQFSAAGNPATAQARECWRHWFEALLHDAGATFDNSLIGLGPHQSSLKLLFMRAATRAIKPVLRRHGDV
jgi:hypothetical protein